jgi:hypothetical protein
MILPLIHVAPILSTKRYGRDMAEDIGPPIFEKIFNGDVEILEQRKMVAPKFLEGPEEEHMRFHTYRFNWDWLIDARKESDVKVIRRDV